jgi:hypothetical protein
VQLPYIPHPPVGEGLIKFIEKAGHWGQQPIGWDYPKKQVASPRGPEAHQRGLEEFTTILDKPQVESIGTRRHQAAHDAAAPLLGIHISNGRAPEEPFPHIVLSMGFGRPPLPWV